MDREIELAVREDMRETAFLQKRASTLLEVDLSKAISDTFGCRVTTADDELDVVCFSNDPQIIFDPIEVTSGTVSVRIESMSSQADHLELFWSEQERKFSQSQSERVPVGARRQTQIIKVVNRSTGKLWVRIRSIGFRPAASNYG